MPWFPICEVRELVRPATGTRGRLPAEAERGRELDRADLVRSRDAEDVAARSASPRDRAVACDEAWGGQRLHDPAAGCLDSQRNARRSRKLEGPGDPSVARARGHETERVVERELAVGDRMPPEVVVRDRSERPGTFRLAHSCPVELVVARRARPRI